MLRSLAVVMLIVGCGSTSVRNVPTGRFFGYTVVGSSSLDKGPPPKAPDKATLAIKKLKRVAFVPPDSCLDMRAADTSTVVDKRVLRMQCGVTMSEMEREAEKAGFDVVTWQSLKGGTKPLEMAKEQKIEILFEVNELDVIEEFDRSSAVEFQYFTGDSSQPQQPLQPLQVTAQDNDACKAFHDRGAPKLSGMTSVLDLKMVQVSTGSVLWSYRHVQEAKSEAASSLIRFQSSARQEVKTSKPWWPWLIVAAGVGVAVAAEQPAIGGGIAVVGLVVALAWPKSTTPTGPPIFEPPNFVLCRRAPIVDAPPPMPVAAEVRSDRFRSESRVSTKDALEEKRRALIKNSATIFFKQLVADQ